MNDWLYLLTPLLVLPIILLFRFVGCGELLDSADDPGSVTLPPGPITPKYPDYVLGHATGNLDVPHPGVPPNPSGVVAYWRLLEPDAGADAQPAFDEKGARNGSYVRGGPLPPDPAGGSQAAPGGFQSLGTALMQSDPTRACRLFTGGYVRVDWTNGLFPPQFTLQAWMRAAWGVTVTGFVHTLFDAGGTYAAPLEIEAQEHGFRVAFNRENRCIVTFARTQGPVLTSAQPVHFGPRTHIALTVADLPGQPNRKRVRLYFDGAPAGEGEVAQYAPPNGAPLLIGVANTEDDPQAPPVVRRPLLGEVQEVVLHDHALSPEAVQNYFAINRPL
jgi:hypothetical protein